MSQKQYTGKILFLGGSYAQIPILKEAKSRGYYIITCDYLPDNPGHKIADEYHNVSTTDKQAVLELAQRIKPNLVIAYASDPAAPVAAYVSEKLGLPGNSYQSLRLLSEKDLFRNLQRENGFNTTKTFVIEYDNFTKYKSINLDFPFIIKPTDSSGSKGVNKIMSTDEIHDAVSDALKYSRNKRILAEEFIDNDIADIHGDGFVVDGKLVFCYLGDHLYNKKTNPYNPIGTLWPTQLKTDIVSKIEKEVNKTIQISGFKNGAINIEARVNSKGQHYIMEIGPRSGGHFVPQTIFYATGFDMVKASLDVLTGQKIILPEGPYKPGAYYAIHSDHSGTLSELIIDHSIKKYIKELHQYIFPGESVNAFKTSADAIGIVSLSFNTMEEMKIIMANINNIITVNIEKKEYKLMSSNYHYKTIVKKRKITPTGN